MTRGSSWTGPVLAAAAILWLTGCKNDAPIEDTALQASCPWRGDWTLDWARCGEYSLPSWDQVYTEVHLSLEGDGTGCEAVVTWSSPECVERETWSFTPVSGGRMPIDRHGIDQCMPEGCTFLPDSSEDAPCEVGDRAVTEDGRVEYLAEDEIILRDFVRHAWPGCGYGEGPGSEGYLPMRTRWVR